jgi:hypothetical protein
MISHYYTISIIGATALRAAAIFGHGTGRVWLDRPQCTLNDTTFGNCTFDRPLRNIRCGRRNDAGVICYTQFGRCRLCCLISTITMSPVAIYFSVVMR